MTSAFTKPCHPVHACDGLQGFEEDADGEASGSRRLLSQAAARRPVAITHRASYRPGTSTELQAPVLLRE